MFWMQGVPGLHFGACKEYSALKLRLVVEALGHLHEAFRNGGQPDRYERVVSKPLQALAHFGPSRSVRKACAELAASISPEWISSLPVFPQHGDFVAINVISNRDRLWVVDWESFGAIDLPYYDLLTFLLSMLRAEGQMPEQWDPAIVRQAPGLLESYGVVLGLCPADLIRLIPLCLANWLQLQRAHGRNQFADKLYGTIQHYFDHQELWQKIFIPAAQPLRRR